MRRSVLFAALLSMIAVPAAAQDRMASSGRGDVLYFRAEAPSARVVLPYTVEQVWRALPDGYQMLGFTATAARDTSKHEVSTTYLQIRGQLYPGEANSLYFDCSRNTPTGPLADQGDITFAVMSHVQPDERGGTAVLTQVVARLKRRDGSQYPVDCISTGRLERTLAQFLRQRLTSVGAIEITRH